MENDSNFDQIDPFSSAIFYLRTRPDIESLILLAISCPRQWKLSFPAYVFSQLLGQCGEFKMADNSLKGNVSYKPATLFTFSSQL